MVTDSSDVGCWGECLTLRIAGGVRFEDDVLGDQGLGVVPPVEASLVASKETSIEKSLLVELAFRA